MKFGTFPAKMPQTGVVVEIHDKKGNLVLRTVIPTKTYEQAVQLQRFGSVSTIVTA